MEELVQNNIKILNTEWNLIKCFPSDVYALQVNVNNTLLFSVQLFCLFASFYGHVSFQAIIVNVRTVLLQRGMGDLCIKNLLMENNGFFLSFSFSHQ